MFAVWWDINPTQQINETTPECFSQNFSWTISQLVADLIFEPTYHTAPRNLPLGMIWLVLLKRSCGASCAEPIEPHSLVAARPEPIGAAGGGMFGFASTHPLAPELER